MVERVKCPVCEKHEFDAWGDFDVCPICGWENDGVQMNNHNLSGGANPESVNEARKIYQATGKYYSWD